MSYCEYCARGHNIGFISTRLAGIDGVSLETEKWAYFKHPQILPIHKASFGVSTRQRALTRQIKAIKHKLISLRAGLSSTQIPNVMDFEKPPPPLDDYAADVRQTLNLKKP